MPIRSSDLTEFNLIVTPTPTVGSTVITADWVLPITMTPIAHGAVVITDGRVEYVGPQRGISRRHDADVIALGRSVLMPGLINAHTHLELTAYQGRIAPCSLLEWLPKLIALRREADAAAGESVGIQRGIEASLRSGVTTVGDISRGGESLRWLAQSPLRAVVFRELISGATTAPSTPEELSQEVASAAAAWQSDRIRVGASPHTPYTVTAAHIQQVAAYVSAENIPACIHVAETCEELQWLSDRSGAMSEFLARFPGLDADAMHRGRLTDLLISSGLLATRPLLVHGNYFTDDDLHVLSRYAASMAYCPRAHRWYGHCDHPWRSMLAAGINVCIGTDSAASNDSLSILDELRFLRREEPDPSSESLLELATSNAAIALHLQDRVGQIHRGCRADLIAIPLTSGTTDPADNILRSTAEPSHVWIDGHDVTEWSSER